MVLLDRCLCVVDLNVQAIYGDDLQAYFAHHEIKLLALVYRALEIVNGIATVERLC